MPAGGNGRVTKLGHNETMPSRPPRSIGSRLRPSDGPPLPARRRALALALPTLALPVLAPLALPAVIRAASAAEPFRIGVPSPVPLPDAARDAVERRFAHALGIPVRLRRFAGAARLVDAAAAGTLDLSIHTALSFATVQSLCRCADPLLRPVAHDGTAGLRAVVIVRDDGPRTLSGLEDGAILGAASGTVAGEVVRRGLSADAARTLRFAGEAPDAALSRFLAGGGIALAGHERIGADGSTLGGTMRRLAEATADGSPVPRLLWRSRPIWHGPLALGADAAGRRDAVMAALLGLSPGAPAMAGLGLGRVRGFAAARAEDYAPLVRLLRR